MRRDIDPDIPLIIGIQPSDDFLYSDLHYSALEWIFPGKLFHSPSFKLKNLFAVGTLEGPIILASKIQQSIIPICFLCGHKTEITCLKMTLQSNTFLSASRDGSIGGWHCDDGSCRFLYEGILPKGEIYLESTSNDFTQVWSWIVGIGIYLIDLSSNKIIMKINEPGLRSFSILTPLNNYFVREDLLVSIGMNEIKYFNVDVKNNLKLKNVNCIHFDINENVNISQFGFCKFEKNKIQLLNPLDLNVLFEEYLDEISENDRIACVKFESQTNFCVSSFGGLFRIYKMKRFNINDTKMEVETVQKIDLSCYFITSFAFSIINGIIFASNAKDILSIFNDKVIKLKIPNVKKKNCFVPNPNQSIVIQSDYSSSFIIYNWKDPKKIMKKISVDISSIPFSRSIDFNNDIKFLNIEQFNSKINITAISAINIVHSKSKLFIIAGDSKGTTYFFFDNSTFPIKISKDLSSSVIAIVQLPSIFSERYCSLGIGEDGSIAFYKWIEFHFLFQTNMLPILAIYYHQNKMIIVETLDGLYIVYNTEMSTPITYYSYLIEGAVLLWSNVSIKQNNELSSTLTFSIGNNSTIYNGLQISKLHSLFTNKEPIPEDCINSLKLAYQVFKPNVELNNSSNSFVLLGSENIPTFFYPMFRIKGSLIFDTSPYNSALYFISYIFIADILGYDSSQIIKESRNKVGDFLSILTQFLFVSDPNLQIISSNICANIIGNLSLQKCNELMGSYIQYFKPYSLADYDKFLLSIIAVEHIEFVQEVYHKILFDYMIKMADSSHISSSLAIIILLDGFEFWYKFAKSKVNLFKFIIKILLKKKGCNNTRINNLLSLFAGTEIEPFFQAINEIINDTQDYDSVSFLCKLCTTVSLSNQQMIGAKGTLALAKIGSHYNQYAKITQKEIEIHSSSFSSIDISENYYVIGLNDGTIHIFKDYKYISSQKLFLYSITTVSIGPNPKYAAALSADEMTLKVFCITKSGLMRNIKLETLTTYNIEGDYDIYEIVWTDSKHCCLAYHKY